MVFSKVVRVDLKTGSKMFHIYYSCWFWLEMFWSLAACSKEACRNKEFSCTAFFIGIFTIFRLMGTRAGLLFKGEVSIPFWESWKHKTKRFIDFLVKKDCYNFINNFDKTSEEPIKNKVKSKFCYELEQLHHCFW